MSFIKRAHGKPRLHVSDNLLFGAWPPCCATPLLSPLLSCTPTSNTACHDNHEKINSWVSFTFYGYGAPLDSLRLLELRYKLGSWGSFAGIMDSNSNVAKSSSHENGRNSMLEPLLSKRLDSVLQTSGKRSNSRIVIILPFFIECAENDLSKSCGSQARCRI